MTHLRDLRASSEARQQHWGGADQIDISFRAIELGGEVGELLNLIKKLIRLRKSITGTKETEEDLLKAIAEELADVVISADLLAGDLGISLDTEVPKKFDKTSVKNNIPSYFREHS